MAAYPSFPQLVGSVEAWVDDLAVDRAVNGAAKVRAFYPAQKRAFQVRHVLNNTDLATLKTFYATNRTLGAIALTWVRDGATYTCAFSGSPQINYLDRNTSEVLVTLVEQ